jgi:hypothetical protein
MDNNISVIVFSKDRPMQLHAYLESLLKFSDADEDNITVILCETEQIRYEKVKASFKKVKWVRETNFEENLKETVSQAGKYIMFGCDDVVFTHSFSLKKASGYLNIHEDVFGFSMRLGQNIVPYPADAVFNGDIMEWDWEKSHEQHYNYPWELDCTLYRKEDVEKLINTEEKVIKNPNYLEAVVTSDNNSEKITRKHLASNKEHGCAVVITVNRVQDSYQNGFDDSMETDIYSLDRLYNDEGNTLDIDRISAKENHTVHVESEFFILRKAAKGYSAERLFIKKFKNIGRDISKFPKKCYNYVERRLYRNGMFEGRINIINTEETLEVIGKSDKSFIRLGESEFLLMMGNSVPSQQYDEKLAKRLMKLLALNDDRINIGVPYYYAYPVKYLTQYIGIRAESIAVQRRFLFRHSNKNVKYIDAGFTQAYHLYEEYDFESHFNKIKGLLKDKAVTLICGEGTLERIDYKLLDVCGLVEYIYAPATEAYGSYDRLLNTAISIDKNRLVCVSLGPAAKPLAYDMIKAGYKVWDIGHLLKDYDTYMKKKTRTETEIIQFYMPD